MVSVPIDAARVYLETDSVSGWLRLTRVNLNLQGRATGGTAPSVPCMALPGVNLEPDRDWLTLKKT